jgi:hypothetical protein
MPYIMGIAHADEGRTGPPDDSTPLPLAPSAVHGVASAGEAASGEEGEGPHSGQRKHTRQSGINQVIRRTAMAADGNTDIPLWTISPLP